MSGNSAKAFARIAQALYRMDTVKLAMRGTVRWTPILCSLHAESHPELLRIQKWFFVLKEDLTHHMQKEEGVLFPYIIHLEEAAWRGEPVPWAPFETIKTPIEMMSLEHDRASRALLGIRAASLNYRLPDQGCASYSLMLQDLQAFERDLLNHIHLENTILFPRAIALEEAAAEAPDRAY